MCHQLQLTSTDCNVLTERERVRDGMTLSIAAVALGLRGATVGTATGDLSAQHTAARASRSAAVRIPRQYTVLVWWSRKETYSI